MFLINVTPRYSFMRLRIISQINRAGIENKKEKSNRNRNRKIEKMLQRFSFHSFSFKALSCLLPILIPKFVNYSLCRKGVMTLSPKSHDLILMASSLVFKLSWTRLVPLTNPVVSKWRS